MKGLLYWLLLSSFEFGPCVLSCVMEQFICSHPFALAHFSIQTTAISIQTALIIYFGFRQIRMHHLCTYSSSVVIPLHAKLLQSCPTLCDSMNCSLPGSSVHGILQARILEWVAVPFSRGASQLRDQIQVSCVEGRFFTIWATKEVCAIYLVKSWRYKNK